MAENLFELLADNGIRPKRLTPGHSEKLVCPKCEGGRTRELSLSLTIDGQGATWHCHRGSCGWRGGGKLRDGESRQRLGNRRERAFQKPAAHTPEQQANKPDWMYHFWADRRIGARTVDAFGIYTVTRRFPEPVGDSPAIVFPYVFGGEVANRKYRPHPDKTPQLQEKDAVPTLFNVDRLGEEPEEIVWAEGEPDVLALYECGIQNAVSLKDGAPKEATFKADDKRFAALATHADLLAKAKRILLAGDMDAPGLALREELARRLGRHRCWLVTWPDGCKDSGDTLQEHGPDTVVDAIRNAVAYPIEGLQEVTGDALLEYRHSEPPPVLTTGVSSTDLILKFPGEGRLIVITGVPNHGKSSWVTFEMMHLIRHHERRFVVFSPEMQPWEQYASLCAQILAGRPFWPGPNTSMSDGDILRIGEWLRPRLSLLVSDAEDKPPTLEWVLDRARAAVLRAGITDLVIDPWNEIEHQRGTMSETDYTGRALQQLRAFAFRHGVNVWIIAHPTKQFPAKPGEAIPPPGLYEISGSANWANKADIGITVHNVGDKTEIHLGKSRFSRWGRKGSKAVLAFDKTTGRYYDPDEPTPLAGEIAL